jgi:hypothetical protein
MFQNIPGATYVSFYFNALLIIVLITFLILISKQEIEKFNPKPSSFIGFILFILLVIWMGYRPRGPIFGDMGNYIHEFELRKNGWINNLKGRDWLFVNYLDFMSTTSDWQNYIVGLALLYLLPCYLVCVKFFKQYWFLGFLMLWTSFSFMTYGTNGLRNGVATSIFLLALIPKNIPLKIGIMILAAGFHTSLFLPTLAYIITIFFKNTVLLLRFWLLCIPISLISGNIFISIVSSIGFGGIDTRMGIYTQSNIDFGYNTNFRLDFLLYSAIAVFAGWYYKEKLKYADKTYDIIYAIYLICNAFWILVIRMPFSNRFAYLSWFLIGLVIIYPLLKHKIMKNQASKIGLFILLNYLFTYTLLVVLQ